MFILPSQSSTTKKKKLLELKVITTPTEEHSFDNFLHRAKMVYDNNGLPDETSHLCPTFKQNNYTYNNRDIN